MEKNKIELIDTDLVDELLTICDDQKISVNDFLAFVLLSYYHETKNEKHFYDKLETSKKK